MTRKTASRHERKIAIRTTPTTTRTTGLFFLIAVAIRMASCDATFSTAIATATATAAVTNTTEPLSSSFSSPSSFSSSFSSLWSLPTQQSQQSQPHQQPSPYLRSVLNNTRAGDPIASAVVAGVVYHPKTPQEVDFLENALVKHILFSSLPPSSLRTLINAFETVTVSQSHVILEQHAARDNPDYQQQQHNQHQHQHGDNNNNNHYVYLVARGVCSVTVDGKRIPEPYGTLKPGSLCGELGVLYKNATRAATVTAVSPTVTLYRVDGDVFKSVLMHKNNVVFEADDEAAAMIDEAIDQVAGVKSLYGGDIIRQYKPYRWWLWRCWSGTILHHNRGTVTWNMLRSFLFIWWIRKTIAAGGTQSQQPMLWKLGLAPDRTHPWIQRLSIVQKLWSYQMSLTTFILTFFLNRAFDFWKEVYQIARSLQGRLNDFHLLLATHADRHGGTYTPAAEQLLEDVGAYSRLFHILFWARYARRFHALQTPRGLERMAHRGIMTSRQLQILTQELDIPDNQRHYACLEWMMTRALQALAVPGGGLGQTNYQQHNHDNNSNNNNHHNSSSSSSSALQWHLMDQMCKLRSVTGTLGDKLDCRMPLAYTHLVQILVDTFCWLSPLALFAELGAYSIFCVGLLTFFYTGLLDLAKIFLDPLDNEKFTKNSIYMDIGVLIRESNAGSTRWRNAGSALPF